MYSSFLRTSVAFVVEFAISFHWGRSSLESVTGVTFFFSLTHRWFCVWCVRFFARVVCWFCILVVRFVWVLLLCLSSGRLFFIPISLTVRWNDSHLFTLFAVWLPLQFTQVRVILFLLVSSGKLPDAWSFHAFHTVVRKCAVRSAMEEWLTSSILRCSRLIKF